ncbi:glucosaminidase domain-containing protein [Hydrogenimonas urashimensis]|uniref:glucosaminidase domain-containing protein n=1 Tax=Hydrogenimonas urashimensis TaxID=2740515 RepID=UPI001915D66F|nr:glucosaminidase domain-containing protein [Hydrogenimonas urashimensis]
MTRLITGFLLTSALLFADAVKSFPKEYYAIKDAKKQKEAFVKILYPLIVKAEEKIKTERTFVETFFAKLERNEIVTPLEQAKLRALAKKYRIKNLYAKEEYRKRIDTIPVSLVLAQASIESNWGRSRFVREANNLFGEWTWGKKGIIPKKREPGKHHKIRIFDSLEESIASYMKNLNRHWAYEEFREARYRARKEGKAFNGFVAAAYLLRYSQLREKYTVMVKNRIEEYAWNLYDAPERTPALQSGNEMAMLSYRIFANTN